MIGRRHVLFIQGLRIVRLEGKAKLSQNRSDADIEGTITGLDAGMPTERGVAARMVRDVKPTG